MSGAGTGAGQGPSRRFVVGAVLTIFAATLAAYWPALHGGLIWDDDAHVTRPDLRSGAGLARIWFRIGATQQYYPVLHSAFWLEHRLWGDAVLGYHLLNVLLHATAACLLAVALGGEVKGKKWPWLAGAIFALHPVMVESVAWISEQKNTLSTVFYLLAALAYLRFDRPAGRRPGAYVLATGLFLLALLSKSVTATLPAALLVVLWWRRGKLEWKRDAVPLLPWFALAATLGLFTAWVERRYIGAEGAAFTLSFPARLLLAGRIFWFYLGKLLWPAHLIFIYPQWPLAGEAAWPWLGVLGLLAGLAVLAVWARRGQRGPLAGVLFFVGSLFPALGFFNVYPFLFSYVADHFQYLASWGIIALAAGAWSWLLAGRGAGATVVFYAGAAGAVALLGTLTWRESGNYLDPVSFYHIILERNPACWMARNNLGEIYTDSGRLPEAIEQYEMALRTEPTYAKGHFNLGIAYSRARRLPEAVEEFATAMRLKPGWAKGEENLAIALAEEGRMDEAMVHFESALRTDPSDPGIHADFALTLANSGRSAEAIAQLTEAARLDPGDPEVHGNLGILLVQAGQGEAAVGQFQEVARLRPGRAEAHLNLAVALIRLHRAREAVAEFQEALRLDPGNPEIREDLARAQRLVDGP